MEGGQKAIISLTSEIDTESNDMLVGVGSPKFLHNRQKMQGRYMPNSVRYEHDGWAVDKDIYEFDKVDTQIPTTPGGYYVTRDMLSTEVPLYKFIIKDEAGNKVGSFKYTPKSSTIGTDDKLSIPISDSLTAVVQYNRTTNKWQLVSGANCELSIERDSQYRYTLTVTNKAKTFENETYTFTKGENIQIGGRSYELEEQTATDCIYKTNDVEITANDSGITSVKVSDVDYKNSTSRSGTVGIKDSTTIKIVPTESKFLTHVDTVGTTEASKLMSTDAEDRSVDSYASMSVSCEECTVGADGSETWEAVDAAILGYDTNGHKYRVRLDVAIPVWGGITFLPGVKHNTKGATKLTTGVDIVSDCQGTLRLMPGKVTAGYVYHYSQTVLKPDITVWQQCTDVTSKCYLGVISPMEAKVSYEYYKVGREEEEITKTEYDELKAAYPDTKGLYWTTKEEEEVTTGSSAENSETLTQTVTKYWRYRFRPEKKTGNKEINISDWAWTVSDIETLLSEDGINKLFKWDTTFSVSAVYNSSDNLDTDYDYGIGNYGKLLKSACKLSSGTKRDTKTDVKLMSDGKEFSDDSYYHTDVYMPSDHSVWIGNTASPDGFERGNDYNVAMYACLNSGEIQPYWRGTDGKVYPWTQITYKSRWRTDIREITFKGGVAAWCYKGVLSKYLSLKESVTKTLKSASEYSAEQFEITDAEAEAGSNAYDISDLFSLEVASASFTAGRNNIEIALIRKGTKAQYVFYPAKQNSTEDKDARKRWYIDKSVDDIKNLYCPGHIWIGDVDSAGNNTSNMKAIAVLNTYGTSTSTSGVKWNLDTLLPKEKTYISAIVIQNSTPSVYKNFETPNVDKHIQMVSEAVSTIAEPVVSVSITEVDGEDAAVAAVTNTVKVAASSTDDDIKDFPLNINITHDGSSITEITTTPTEVTGKGTFDLKYTPNVDNKEVKVDYIAYLPVVLGTRYSIAKAGTAVTTTFKDGIMMATVSPSSPSTDMLVKIGYGFKNGKVYVSFDTDVTDLENYDLNSREYILRGTQTEKTITFNTYEKVVASGLTVDCLYEIDGVSKAELLNGVVQFRLDRGYSIALSAFDDATQKSYLMYSYTRVDDGEENKYYLGKQYTEGEFQFLKQQWNTNVDVQNFWWIDQTHILVLTQKDIKVLEKTEGLDDWAADKWEEEKVYNRFDYITNDVLNYLVPNIKGSVAAGLGGVFITFEAKSRTSFLINVYDPQKDMNKVSVEVNVNKVAIGEMLNEDSKQSMNTYSQIVIENMLSQAQFTGTLLGKYILIGIHYDNNFNQWTLVFDRTLSLQMVVQGYGYVGVNCVLTGGEIPKKYFSTQGYLGFNSRVEDISVLGTAKDEDKVYVKDIGELSTFTERVVGTDNQQWYISPSLQDVVSHIKVAIANDVIIYTPEYLPISNNYSVGYASGSFNASVIGDTRPQLRGLTEFISGVTASGWSKFLSLASSPQVCFFAARLSTMVYLQQTLGQAAYVHYNSQSVHQSQDLSQQDSARNFVAKEAEVEKTTATGVTSDSIAFDFQSVRQTGMADTNLSNNLLILIGSAAATAVGNIATEKMKINSTKNLTTAGDYGKAFGTYFVYNLASAAVSDFVAIDMNPKENSEVSAMKTLDMFYSTCAEQKICAGSGWVNHNFVAQCTSQSVTSVQQEGRQQRYLVMISAITMIPIRAAYEGAALLVANLDAVMKNTDAGPDGIIGFASGGNYAEVATHYAAQAGYAAAKAAELALETLVELMPTILQALGADKFNTSVTAAYTKHNVDIEASHKYGTKHEYFMYPCWNCTGNTYTDEGVSVGIQNKQWFFDMESYENYRDRGSSESVKFTTSKPAESVTRKLKGDVDYFVASIKGYSTERELPIGMACVEGVKTFLPTVDYKNENIGESEPVFTTPPFQDYIIDEGWQLSQTASVGMTVWISCKDTKLIDGEASNMCITDEFCGVASPYTAIEIKKGIEMKYLRPFALTPKVLSLNCTGYNCLFDERMYHAFDGYGYRLVNWVGESGLAKGNRAFHYNFLINDRFKRSNKMPPNIYFGNFQTEPTVALKGTAEDKVLSMLAVPEEGRGLIAGVVGEDRDVRRYAVPIFSEFVSTMPAIVKTISSYNLTVYDGITTLTADNHDLQSAYKSPTSVDFSIGESKFRYTEEYICSLEQAEGKGVTVVEPLCPCIGLTYLGATPTEALFYSRDNKQYYKYSGGKNVQLISMLERFRNIISGRYDFINQEIIVPALSNFKRLDDKVEDDKDETDNVIVLRLNGQAVQGEITPPLDTIYKTKEIENFPSWFRTLSLPMGLTYQGPNRCIVNRFIVNEYMLKDIRNNYGKWVRVPKEEYHPFRKYKAKFESVEEFIGDKVKVKGWTHNPFLLVTAPLGVNEETDCLFEWNITFVWTKEMDMLYNKNEYAVVNLLAETMAVGGKVIASRPTHIYLTKELFTRTGNYGYYSFRYQSNCGSGNRERLHIWSDQYIAISDLTLEYKPVTQRHNDVLTQQVDISELVEV